MLWKKVMPKLSAGRVQSVATRIIVQRERERMAFRSRRVLGHLRQARRRVADGAVAAATLRRAPGQRRRRRVAAGRDFGSDGQLKTAPASSCSTRPTRAALAEALARRRTSTVSLGRGQAVHAASRTRRS